MKGQKDLRQAAACVFQTTDRPEGDDPTRATFFDHQLLDDRGVRLILDRRARLPWYSADKHKRRIPMTVPDKLRENMRELLGVECDDDYAVTTTLVALADYACMVLASEQKTLRVSQPKGAKRPRTTRGAA
jgi:hypothetical protein